MLDGDARIERPGRSSMVASPSSVATNYQRWCPTRTRQPAGKMIDIYDKDHVRWLEGRYGLVLDSLNALELFATELECFSDLQYLGVARDAALSSQDDGAHALTGLRPMNVDALSFATADLWCIAPGQTAAINRPSVRLPQRESAGVVAVVELLGALTKAVMVPLRQTIAALAGNDLVGEIVIIADTPGGTVAGTFDLHSAIAAAAQQKRVTAVIEDMACSGGLYAICGATEIVIGETAVTGSIGVFSVVYDESKLMERLGIEVIIVRSGEHKGAGVSGAKITPEQVAELKRRVDVQARHFVAAVARGRGMSIDKAAELADGRVFIGREAIAAGLADRIGTVESTLAEAAQRTLPIAVRSLTGIAAAEKFREPVATEKRAGLSGDTAEFTVAHRFPELAAAAKKAERDRECRVPLDWRPSV